MRLSGIVISSMTMCLIRLIVRSVIHNPVAVPSMFDLDQEVAKAHQSVTEIESQARAIEARIRSAVTKSAARPATPATEPLF